MPYPYTLMSDGHTLEPDYVPPKPPATTQEESEPDLPWYYSIFPAPVPESPDEGEGPPVQQTLVNRPPVATRPQPTSIPDDILDYEREQEKRLGLSPASQNDERSRSGSSQTKILADTNQANDESPVQEVLPDIAEGQDDFDANAVFDGIISDRLFAYSNLDIIRVRQDMETRPLTFKLAFEQHESPRSACEFLYAEVPDCNDTELAHLQQVVEQQTAISVGMGGDPDETGGSGFSVPRRSLIRYEEHLESKYEFDIEWGEASDDRNMPEQLNNLAKAIAYIVNYLSIEVYDGDESKALAAFQQYFSQNTYGKLVVFLGADDDNGAGGSGLGKVPLQKNLPVEELRKMYLGSAVDIPTIVHEFGHVIDRSKGFTAYLEETVEDPTNPSQSISRLAAESGEYFNVLNEGWRSLYSFNPNRDVLDLVIEGFVAKQSFAAELWADLFMTAVLSGEGFVVESVKDRTYDEDGNITDDPIAIFANFTDPEVVFRCGIDAPCFDRAVQWEDTYFAKAAQWYLPKVFLALLSG